MEGEGFADCSSSECVEILHNENEVALMRRACLDECASVIISMSKEPSKLDLLGEARFTNKWKSILLRLTSFVTTKEDVIIDAVDIIDQQMDWMRRREMCGDGLSGSSPAREMSRIQRLCAGDTNCTTAVYQVCSGPKAGSLHYVMPKSSATGLLCSCQLSGDGVELCEHTLAIELALAISSEVPGAVTDVRMSTADLYDVYSTIFNDHNH